jgi:hypothetical protein
MAVAEVAEVTAPRGFLPDDKVVRWRDCPDCGGRGWFLINLLARGIGDMTQCRRCLAEYRRAVAEGAVNAP